MVESMQDDRDFLKTNPVVKLVDLGLSEYALTIVAEYADVEVSACRRCHGWGCRPGPCRETLREDDEKALDTTGLDETLPSQSLRIQSNR